VPKESVEKTAAEFAAELNRDTLIAQAVEIRQLRSLVDEAKRFIDGFAASAESGFTRRRKALEWIKRYKEIRDVP
jgi:hypothetical protein